MTTTSPATDVQQIELGAVTVTRVHEYFGSVDMTPESFFPDSTRSMWDENIDSLVPDFLDTTTGFVQSTLQTWLLRSGDKTILVDTGVGNGKERPYAQIWAHRNSGYLTALAHAGVRPEDVDIVVNTHLHNDHVGWNTVLSGREWVPTFPNARYLMPARDFEYWDPTNGRGVISFRGNQNVFEDSIAPVHRAGLVDLWDDQHIIDDNLRLELAPGHTPGSSVLTLNSADARALFVGDLLHNPVQILHPQVNSCFCVDPDAARTSRTDLLARSADQDALVFPAHLGSGGGFRVRPSGSGFAISEWAPFDSPRNMVDN